MDLLIDIIVYVVRQLTKDQPRRVTPANFQEIERQKAATEQRIREMQAALANQGARAKPVRPNRGPVRRAPVTSAARSVTPSSSTPTPRPAPAPASSIPIVTRAHSQAPRRDFRIPVILGEILAPPLSLREMEL